LFIFFFFFFFSSRRRHTRSYGDWSSDCALPIFSSLNLHWPKSLINPSGSFSEKTFTCFIVNFPIFANNSEVIKTLLSIIILPKRSEERRVGKELNKRM